VRETISDISSLLDGMIEKAEKKEEPQKIRKALSFNPATLTQMTHESMFYNPYRTMSDGTFLPYTPEYWADQGKDPDDYYHERKIYAEAGYYHKAPVDQMVWKVSKSLKDFRKSLAKAIKKTIDGAF